MSNNELRYIYRFNFGDNDSKFVSVRLVDDLWVFEPKVTQFPEWTYLDNNKCKSCPLHGQKYCPAAQAIYQAVFPFVDEISFHTVELVVESAERHYVLTCTMQAALSSLIGLVLPFSGCPQMKFFKPMAHMHLPLATEDETVFRVCSAFFLQQFFKGDQRYASLDQLNDVYEVVREVNRELANRVRAAGNGDSVANAVVILDCFTRSVPYFVKRSLSNLAPLFES